MSTTAQRGASYSPKALLAVGSPIFVVGASRSGTSVMQAMLNRHPKIELQGESHYFDDLRPRMAGQLETRLRDGDMRKMVEDYFLALEHRPYGHAGDPEKSTMPRHELRAAAETLGETVDAYFESFCKIYTVRAGAHRWGEKTPRHVYRIANMIGAYPDAQVIGMVRDARAVVASYRDWKNQGGFDLQKDPEHARALQADESRARRSYHPILASMLWRGSVRAILGARERFGAERVRLQRYEDLVQRPEQAARDVCQWLSVPFDATILDVPMRNSSYSSYAQESGFQTQAVDRWREKLSDRELAVIQRVCRKELQGAGYELLDVGAHHLYYVWSWITLPFAGVRAVLANRERIHNLPAYIWRRLRSGR